MLDYTYEHPRSSLSITLSVWKALFLREAVHRLSVGRGAWVWLLFEPLLHITYMLVMFAFIRMHQVGGIDSAVWIMVGMLYFFVFRRTNSQTKVALSANMALFTYRQVKPIDTALVRAALEGFLMILVAVILAVGGGVAGLDLIPDQPLDLFIALWGMWLMGLGFGLVASVGIKLIPEVGKIIDIIMMPVYMLSGLMIPVSSFPKPYSDWLLYNPLIHGIETARVGMSSYYHVLPGLDIMYLYKWALVTVFFGLALYKRFETKLVMQ